MRIRRLGWAGVEIECEGEGLVIDFLRDAAPMAPFLRSIAAAPAKDLMTEVRKQNEVDIRKRLLQARKAGELASEIDLGDYARYLSMLLAGLSIQAANGPTKAELKRTAPDGSASSGLLTELGA